MVHDMFEAVRSDFEGQVLKSNLNNSRGEKKKKKPLQVKNVNMHTMHNHTCILIFKA